MCGEDRGSETKQPLLSPFIRGARPKALTYLDHVADLEVEHVARHVSVGVDLDHQLKVALIDRVTSHHVALHQKQHQRRGCGHG